MNSSEESNMYEIRKEEDIFTILVATDIHLGFEEKDPIRGTYLKNHVFEFLLIS